jgi:dTDP-4-amino-4,6-dideoxygalactose transaminase
MKIPFLNFKRANNFFQKEIHDSLKTVINSGQFILGDHLEKFEFKYANFCNAKFCVGTANGLEALQLSLLAAGVGEGDEVIVPAHTFIATWLAVSHVNAIPIPIEPDYTTYNIDTKLIEEKISKKTKAIIPVHLYGHPADLEPIIKIAKKYNLIVIEDASQAHGAIYNNQIIGSHGHMVTWSFYPGKNLGAYGDAGAITTNYKKYADKLKMLRNYGSNKKYINNIIGLNSRLDPIQASILSVKLKYLKKSNIRRQIIANKYIHGLSDFKNILPIQLENVSHVWHLFVIRHKLRNKLKLELQKKGISSLIHYPVPPHLQKAYKNLNIKKGSLPITEKNHREVLSLPIDPFMSNDEVNYVIESTKKLLNKI